MAIVNLDKKTKDRLEAVGITVDNELAQKIKSKDTGGIVEIAFIREMGKEYEKAMELYKLAAEKKDAYAAFQIGELYSKGHGVGQNRLVATEWYLKAFTLGYKDALLKVRSHIDPGKCLPEQNDLDFKTVGNILLTDNALTPPQREEEKESTIKRPEPIIQMRRNPFAITRNSRSPQKPPNGASNNKRKIEQEVEEKTNKKTKTLEDKIELLESKLKMGEENTKLLEDKVKLWEEKAKMGEDKAKLWEEKASILQQSNQSLITLLEQEKQIKNNQVNLLNQKIEDLENRNKRTGGLRNIKLEEI